VNGKKTEVRESFSGFTGDGFQAVLESRLVPETGTKTNQAKPAAWKRVMTVNYTKFVPGPGMWRPGLGPRQGTLPPNTTPPATPPPNGNPPADERPKG